MIPPAVIAEAQRILDGAARRLLAARLDRDPIGATPGSDVDPVEHGTDEGAPLGQGEHVPVTRRNGQPRPNRGL